MVKPVKRGACDPVFGVLQPIPINQLPLVRDVGRSIALKCEELKDKVSGKSLEPIFEEVSDQIIEVYVKASVPTVTRKNVKLRVNLWQKRSEQVKNPKRRNKKKMGVKENYFI